MSSALLPLTDSPVNAPHPGGGAAPACEAWVIGTTRYTHSAAQFWPRLLDEVWAFCDVDPRIALEAVTAERLSPARLDPLAELNRDIEALARSDLAQVMRETAAQLECLGPPGLIRVRVFAGPELRLEGELPGDAVDTESFIYLAGWVLEWSRIPHAQWEGPRCDGLFVARDPRRRRDYHVRHTLTTTPLPEGLLRHTLSIAINLTMP